MYLVWNLELKYLVNFKMIYYDVEFNLGVNLYDFKKVKL